ncbi:MAG: hypothetical protein JXA50_09630 [Deltaproteobacteria bacterium]|nr:hypothetical protein [Deltaproteobacteria bacterium]
MIKILKNIVPVGILIAALIQWYGIGERTYHGWWMWYKFKDYGGGVPTDLSFEMTIITYLLSAILISSGYYMHRHGKLNKLCASINIIAVFMLLIGLGWLSILLASPFAVLVKR